MTASLFLIILAVCITLLKIGYSKSHILLHATFQYVRKSVGITLACYGAAMLSQQCIGFGKGWAIFSVLLQAAAWIYLILTLHGLFEVFRSEAKKDDINDDASE